MIDNLVTGGGSLLVADLPPVQLRHASRPGWFVIENPENAAAMRKYPGVVDSPISTDVWAPWNLAAAYPHKFEVLSTATKKSQAPNALWPGLRGYQRECVEFGRTRQGGGVYLGLDLGLGKTSTAASIAVSEGHERVVILGR